MAKSENKTFRVKTDGFFGELFLPEEDKYPEKALICFSGSDGGIELTKMLAQLFQTNGLTTLALAYVMEEGLLTEFTSIPIDFFGIGGKTPARNGIQQGRTLWHIKRC